MCMNNRELHQVFVCVCSGMCVYVCVCGGVYICVYIRCLCVCVTCN